jgi:RNA polymerase sigma-70 factor (ECF subfamily)
MSSPGPLSALLLQHLQATEPPPPDLEQKLADVLQAGRAAWPGVDLDAAAFVRHLAGHLPADGAPWRGLPFLLAGDLYLACACVHGVPAALQAFEARYLSQVGNFLAHLDRSPDFADEVRQVLRERLLLPAPDGARLAEYSGRGALLMWLRVAALRTALNLRRSHGRHLGRLHPPREEELTAAALPERLDPEFMYLKTRYAQEFAEAVRAAVGTLSSEQRVILRLYWVGGQSGERIAALFRVNRSTVTRWLAASREAILAETRRLLCERLHLSPAEFTSLARDLRSQLDLSLATLLRDE